MKTITFLIILAILLVISTSIKANPVDDMERTIYNEARAEEYAAMKGMASTIRNRHDLNRSSMGGENYSLICKLGYAGYYGPEPKPDNATDEKAYENAISFAITLYMGILQDTVKKSTHYATTRDALRK